MKYYSLNTKNHTVSFREAVINGLAPDSGLYFPETITPLPSSFFDTIETLDKEEVAFHAIRQFIGDEIPETELKKIIMETISFDFPIIPIEETVFALELYHGPTMAFKDVGARFMSRCLGYFNRANEQKNTVLVATSGDTGGAVANGFLDVKNIEVVILYPAGKVSHFQELQLTTLGGNIKAIEVNGSFDDCQAMVKKAFLDTNLKEKYLTSANSINIARWLPQMFYFFFAYRELKKHGKPIIVSCPSGNFGNICAGIMAKRLGLPIAHFVAATNANDTVPRFMESGNYAPKPTIATLSNAMDVSDPSNFIRIQELYNNDLKLFENDFSAFCFTDEETEIALQNIYNQLNYIAEPHGAIGYLGLKKGLKKHPGSIGVFLETAHPIKFSEIVTSALHIELPVPEQIQKILDKKKTSIKIDTYEELQNILLG
ncbi:threonine synthase [Flavobacterium humi]|uniref:Threonine synthase n=1 Tax=Flavobacterium humi TaxID=2562683 RepID=A0A4Z0LCZ6_9FLAO|nr:threonine synthase [Flavobacterium humi]TGD59756.1 threonine synthase [Flavobacterium humi]